MPAEFDTGMFVRTPAWHGEGYVADRYPANWQEARKWAGLLWEPVEAPNFGYNGITEDGKVTHDPDDADTGDYFRDGDSKRLVRSDTGFKLSVRDNSYEVITHEEMGAVMDAVLDLPNIKYDTAGSLMGGRRVWALVYLDEPIQLPGDASETFPYMAFLNRHDGTGAFKALATSVRVVCSNTFSFAEMEGERSGAVFTFYHSKNWKDHIEEAKLAVHGQREAFAKYVALATDLADVKVSPEQEERFVVEFIPVPPSALVSDRVTKNVEAARQAVRDIIQGQTVESIRGTGFGLLQAAGEYLDHYRKTRTDDSHYVRQLLRPEPLKTRATKLVREIVNV